MTVDRSKERHHYVSQWYLRFWSEDWNGEDGTVWVHSIDGRKAFRTSTRTIASEKGLHDTANQDPDLSKVDYEDRITRLELLYAKRWVSLWEEMANDGRRMNLARFLALQHLRHPNQISIHKEFSERIRGVALNADPNDLIEVSDGKRSGRIVAAEVLKNTQNIPHAAKGGYFRSMRSEVEHLAGLFFERKWALITATDPTFITTDCPIGLLRNRARNQSFGFATPGTMILFPISPHRLLMIDDDLAYPVNLLPLKKLGDLNEMIAQSAQRFAFAWGETPKRLSFPLTGE